MRRIPGAILILSLLALPAWPEPSTGRIVQLEATLAGQVVDPEGRPVAGASVTAYPTESEWTTLRPEARATRAGAEGRFLLNGLPQKKAYRLFVQAQGFVPTWWETALGKPGPGAPPVRIVLSPGVVFTGRIVDPDGRPIAGADLALSTAADGLEGTGASMSSGMKASSETSGRFRFEHVGTGAFSLQVTRPGFAPAFRSGTAGTNPRGVVDIGDLTLEPGVAIEGRVTHIELRPARSLSGRVLDDERRPVGGARIALIEIRESGAGTNASVGRWSNEVDQTDEEGRFVLNEIDPGLGPGPWHLEVRAPGFRTAETGRLQIPDDGEAAPLEIILNRGATLEGRVLDGDGQPVPQTMIDVIAPDSYRISGPFHWTDDLGRYRIDGLGPGEHRVRAGGRGVGAEGKIILGDSGTYRLDLRFPPGVEVSGRVVDVVMPGGTTHVQVILEPAP
jgi:protocatechuate 3,4-dioxygenase beta subunit